jgi:outer membrane protein OmpA-like peptidoglycan-associated protein
VAHYFSDPYGALDANGKSGGAEATGPVLNPEPGKRFTVKPTVIKEINSRQFELGTIVYFDAGSAELSEEGKASLDALVPFLDGHDFVIEIRGHASTVVAANGTIDPVLDDTWSLSCARTLCVRRYLEDWGISAHRMRLMQAGPFEPATNPDKRKRQYENERVEIYVPRQLVEGTAETARGADEPDPDSA